METMKKPPYSYTITRNMLRYIAKSPPKEWGGFDESLVMVAKSALWYLRHGKPGRKKT